MAPETFTHGGEDLFSKGVFLARTEAGVERCRKDFGGSSLLHRGLNGPTPFPRIFHEARITTEFSISRQCGRSQIEQPRRDDAPASPELGDVGEVKIIRKSRGQIMR